MKQRQLRDSDLTKLSTRELWKLAHSYWYWSGPTLERGTTPKQRQVAYDSLGCILRALWSRGEQGRFDF